MSERALMRYAAACFWLSGAFTTVALFGFFHRCHVPAPEPPKTPGYAQKKADAPQRTNQDPQATAETVNEWAKKQAQWPETTVEQLRQKNEAQDKEIKRLASLIAGRKVESASEIVYAKQDAETFNQMYRRQQAIMRVLGIEVDAYGGIKWIEPLQRKEPPASQEDGGQGR